MSTGLFLAAAAVLLLGFVAFRVWRNKADDAKLTASTCGAVAYPGGTMDPNAHWIGPTLPDEQGGDMSRGMPQHPQISDDGWLYFDLPDDGGVDLPLGTGPKADYVLWRNGSLEGFSRLVLDVRTEGTGVPYSVPEQDPTLKMPLRITSIIIEDKDNFTADAAHEDFRWFHEDASLDYLPKPEAGVLRIVADLHDAVWTGTQFSTLNPADKGGTGPDGSRLPEYNPTGFANAKKNACCVGFVLGGDEVGIGHGGRSRGPVRVYYKMTAE